MSDNALVGFVGMKGQGKTHRLRMYARRCRRAMIVDCEAKWELMRGDIIVESGAECRAALERAGALDPAQPIRLVCRDDYERLAVWPVALAYAVRNLTLVIDEAAWLCTPNRIPEWLARVFQFGRDRRVNLLWTTRDPQEVHRFFTSQADVLHFFRVQPGAALDYLRRRWGSELADQVSTFPLRRFCTYGHPAKLALFGREGLDFSLALPHS